MNLKQLQEEMKPWVKHNFGDRPPHWPLLGVAEEVGELCHAHLKAEQGIRMNEDHTAKGKDAVGDILIYLSDYCISMGYVMEDILEKTWNDVRQRDWKKFPINGKTK